MHPRTPAPAKPAFKRPLSFIVALWAAQAATALAQSDPRPAHPHSDPQSPPGARSGAPITRRAKQAIPSPITDRFYVRGTFFAPSIDTSIQVNARNGTPGTLVSAEKDLGVPSHPYQGRIELMFRMRERNKLRVDYFETDRSGSKVLSRTVFFGNQTFVVNDLATSSLDWRMFGLTYTYSLLRTDRLELGTGIGVHLLEAEARGAVQAKELQQEVSGAGAFPTIPIDFAWRISRRFALTGRGQYMHFAHNGFAASLQDYHGDVQYRWIPNFSIGAGYTVIRASLDLTEATFPGRFRLTVKGPEAFFRVSF